MIRVQLTSGNEHTLDLTIDEFLKDVMEMDVIGRVIFYRPDRDKLFALDKIEHVYAINPIDDEYDEYGYYNPHSQR